MAIHVALNHKTHYKYERPIEIGPQVVRLRPAPHNRTPVLGYTLKVKPEKHFINWQQDPQGNYQARLVFPEKATELLIEVDLVVEMSVLNPFDFFTEKYAEHFPFAYEPELADELKPFLQTAPAGPLLTKMLSKLDRRPRRTNDFIVELNQFIQRQVNYVIRLEPGVQTCEETLASGKGSCRDSAFLLVQTFRHLGYAARFVSGYLIQLAPDVKSLDGPSGPEKDFTDLHAWAEVYLPGAGWIGLDATSGLLCGEGHIPLAATPEPSSAAPVSGLVEKCESKLDFAMSVRRIYESPRVTKPYSEEQWKKIYSLGHQVDQDIVKRDIRLTMGGEPTFVSVDDMDGAEWNTEALGPTKRRFGANLVRRLKNAFAPGALLHFGQGKWYPGESLPRWAFGCYWRKDGVPMWENPDLIAYDSTNYGFGEAEAQTFIRLLAANLGVTTKFIMPTYEDAFYYMWKERRLPVNVDPLKSNLKEKEERTRLAKIFEQGLNKTIGYVLPVKSTLIDQKPVWHTGPWFLRPENCYLIPGDSPIGYRLPLDSIPWVAQGDYPYINELDPTIDRPPLPPRRDRNQRFVAGAPGPRTPEAVAQLLSTMGEKVGPRYDIPPEIRKQMEEQVAHLPAAQQSAWWVVRTALCVEPRQGKLHVFMPPTKTLEEYLDVAQAVEETAEYLEMPVMLEGYTPPTDPRVNVLKVTPDPGVIEVNMHPANTWEEMVHQTTTLYSEARETRLTSEKFMLDGRHVGTGGGNHIVVGASTPADSPFLRRPDLLRSLVNYWHNHPSLSFLFSGQFIGPTSQHPRVDEARNDSLYELEIAFKEMEKQTGNTPPWMLDRLLRNLMTDVTGNTHRAEFSIDKLYSPDSSSGRLGLIELRAFEMPPHPQMSLTQQLLMRSLISHFWKEPYKRDLVRWDTELHDRFMLPHFVRDDFNDVIEDLRDFGYPFEQDWFAPHHEFRFPLHGDVSVKNIHVEVRHALEPWHVMGEEAAAGGTARYVDSSVERLQVKVQGMVDGRHAICVGGQTMPLHPTGTNGEFVAGLRYRAWQPYSALHPTIGIHSPLHFNIVDTWNDKAIGGCVYHVVHPGGRGYELFPVNAYEAESRRLNRFYKFGHTPGRCVAPAPVVNPDFPLTLDLRKS